MPPCRHAAAMSRRRSCSTWSSIRATKGEITTTSPERTRQAIDNRGICPPVGKHGDSPGHAADTRPLDAVQDGSHPSRNGVQRIQQQIQAHHGWRLSLLSTRSRESAGDPAGQAIPPPTADERACHRQLTKRNAKRGSTQALQRRQTSGDKACCCRSPPKDAPAGRPIGATTYAI